MIMTKNYSRFFLAIFCLFTISSIHAQMVGTNAYIQGTNVEVGIQGLGGFEGVPVGTSAPFPTMHPRSSTGYFGFVANPELDGWATFNGDYFTPGTPENGWGMEIGAGGTTSQGNNCAGTQQINGTITNWTHNFDCYSSDWEGDMTSGSDLHFKINYFLQETDLFYTTTVSITNNTGATIPDMYYYRNVDPDNNEEISFDYTTQNTIVSEPGGGACDLAHVKATSVVPASQPLSYLGFAALGPNFRVGYGGFSNRDASDMWTGTGFTQTVGSTNFADEAIYLAYRIQNLAPGATETFKFVVILDDASSAAAINNLLYLFYPGSSSAPPAICTPYTDTARTCGMPVPVAINGTAVGDFSWSWSPGATLSDSTLSSTVANPLVTTTYTVTGTPLSACVSPVSFVIVVEVTPAAGANPVIGPEPPICVNDPPFNLTVDSTGGTWTGTGITSGSLGTFNPLIAGPGTFMITYTRPGGCNNSDTALITVTTVADATISSTPLLCVGDAAITMTGATPGGTWSGIGITDTTAGTFNPATAGAGSFTITYTVPGSCTATDTAIVNVTALFDATIAPHPAICNGSAPFNLSAATGGGTYSGTGITSGAAGTFDPTVAGPGIHVITYTIPGSCGNTDTLHINVLPNANATITAVAPLCANASPFNFSGVTPGGTWSGIGITNSSTGAFDPSIAGPGTYTITYSVAGMCGDTASRTITVNPLPAPTVSSLVTSGCVPFCAHFTEGGSSCSSVLYNFGDAGLGDTSVVANPTYCYNNPGTYTVTMICTDANGCKGTATNTNMITVYPIPTANFNITPGTSVTPGTTVTVTDATTGGGGTFWTFGDPTSSSNTANTSTASHTYPNEGSFCIVLYATNAGGCLDSMKYCVEVVGEATIIVPNVFTPNGDGNNDVFYFNCHNVASLHCVIYDRWGLKVAELNGPTSGWDGDTLKGGKASDGTYFFILDAKGENGKDIQDHGALELIRDRK